MLLAAILALAFDPSGPPPQPPAGPSLPVIPVAPPLSGIPAGPQPLSPVPPPEVPPPLPGDPTAVPLPAVDQFTCYLAANRGCAQSAEACREKAIAAMARKGFRFGEVRDDGSVTGYSTTCRALV